MRKSWNNQLGNDENERGRRVALARGNGRVRFVDLLKQEGRMILRNT